MLIKWPLYSGFKSNLWYRCWLGISWTRNQITHIARKLNLHVSVHAQFGIFFFLISRKMWIVLEQSSIANSYFYCEHICYVIHNTRIKRWKPQYEQTWRYNIFRKKNMTFITDSVVMCCYIREQISAKQPIWTELWIDFKTLIFKEDILLHHQSVWSIVFFNTAEFP
jgi:hypothetical protein